MNLDVADGMRRVTEHLLELGHRRFLHLASAAPSWTFDVRAATLAHALRGAEVRTVRSPLNVADAWETARLALAAPGPRPTAVICDDDILAVGVCKAARRLGLRVPEDLSVTGFDDMALATVVEPELTTVRLPAEEFGRRGMEALLAVLAGDPPPPYTLPVTLAARAPRGPSRLPEGGQREGAPARPRAPEPLRAELYSSGASSEGSSVFVTAALSACRRRDS